MQLRHNAASVLSEGRILETYAKRELPNYQVFDERRYFTPGAGHLRVRGRAASSVGLLICEDAWFDEPAQLAKDAGAEVLAVINASPFHVGKEGERVARMAERARRSSCRWSTRTWWAGRTKWCSTAPPSRCRPTARWRCRRRASRKTLVFAQTGAHDGRRRLRARRGGHGARRATPRPSSGTRWCWACATTSARTAFPARSSGLSGGIDSALVLAIAVDALGKDKVRAVMMPSPYTADISWIDAREMAGRLGVRYDEISIKHTFESFLGALAERVRGPARGHRPRRTSRPASAAPC